MLDSLFDPYEIIKRLEDQRHSNVEHTKVLFQFLDDVKEHLDEDHGEALENIPMVSDKHVADRRRRLDNLLELSDVLEVREKLNWKGDC